MDHARIRWRNVARLAAVIGAGGLLIVVVPGALEPPQPQPLPDDIGLAGAYAATPRPELALTRERISRDGPDNRIASPPHRRSQSRTPRPDRRPRPQPAMGGQPRPATTVPAPAPVAAPPPAPQSAPSDEPVAQPQGNELPPRPHGSARGPSAFGFEH